MKQLLLFLLVLVAGPCAAQIIGSKGPSATPKVLPYYSCTEPVSRQQHYADSLLGNLNKAQIPTHILYDRVVGLASLDVFNLVYNNPDTSNVSHFLQAYYELHAADYNNRHTDPCRQVLADNARHYQQQGIILLGALRYEFNYIDSNAVRNNQLRWDTQALSKLYDVPGRSASPYRLREVAVADRARRCAGRQHSWRCRKLSARPSLYFQQRRLSADQRHHQLRR